MGAKSVRVSDGGHTLEAAKREIAAVNRALRAGHPPANDKSGCRTKTAVRVAAETLKADRDRFTGRVGTPTRPGHYQNKFGLAPNWKLYKPAKTKKVDKGQIAKEHAHARARALSSEITSLVTGSHYPIINTEAIVVESYLTRRYNRASGGYEIVEGTPRTWLSDTIRVEPIKNCANKRFIFTGAQNDAEVHGPFWDNLQVYADAIDAKIVIGPWTYETQWWSENNPASRAYAPELTDYLCFGQMAIGDDFVFCGEMNTLPTASRPISDLVTYSRGRWAVFPHAKIQLKSVPSTDPSMQAHQVMTSGAVTKPKVIARKAGVKSIFHHIIGATVVEFDRAGRIFCRQINATDDGSFYDIPSIGKGVTLVQNGKVTNGHRAKSIVVADLHRAKLRSQNVLGTFGLDLSTGNIVNSTNLIDVVKPEVALFHDIFDMQSRNHHNAKDNAYAYEQAVRGRESVLGEVEQAADFLISIARPWMQETVIDSNHDLALERYVREGRYRMDGANIRVGIQLEDAYLGYREQVAQALETEAPVPSFSMLEYAMRALKGKALEAVKWVHDGKSFLIDGIEHGHHGFRGANGAKGTVSGFARIGRKMSIGDKHSPEIMDAVYVAGAMELQHGYNKGPSGWCTSHILQYQNGKRTILTMQEGRYRA